MFHSRWRYALIGALAVLLVTIVAVTAFAKGSKGGSSGGSTGTESGAFTITSVSPNPFDPTQGLTLMYYTVPTAANYSIIACNSAGTEVTGIVSYSDQPAGTYNHSWTGKSNSGAVLPNGNYTLVIQGTTTSGVALTTATVPVTIAVASSTPPPTPAAFAISSITPNPYNPTAGSATITYTVPVKADVTVSVSNSSGTLVDTLPKITDQATGTQTATWNGENSSGAVVPNGTYTVTVSGDDTGTTTAITSATATIPVAASTTTPPATPAFAISSITPNPYNPTAGSATITYTVPVKADVTVSVSNSSGTVVDTLPKITGQAAGTQTATWNGENTSSAVVPNGTYTVTVSGDDTGTTTVITSATATIPVAASTVTPPPPSSGTVYGMSLEGCGSANFAWLQYASTERFGVMFIAPKSGTITSMTEQWKDQGGYGGGNYGTFTFQLESNGTGNFPSGTVLAQTTGIAPTANIPGGGDGPLTFPISCTLTAGTIYHLVISDTDPNPSVNWSSPNTLMAQVLPWNGAVGNRGECLDTVNGGGGTWQPWTSQSNIWGSSSNNFLNGAHVPLMLTWSDGTNTGDPYYSAAESGSATVYGTACAGELIDWTNPTTTVSQLGTAFGKVGSPAGSLIYHLSPASGGTDLATGTMQTAAQTSTVPAWTYVTLSAPVTLTQGQSYRLWFASPSSTSSSNCYYQYPPYGEQVPAAWIANKWNGMQSYFELGTSGGSWSEQNGGCDDMTFTLQ